MANCGNLKRCGWFRRHPGWRESRGRWPETGRLRSNRNDGPGQLNLSAAVYLGRLALIIRRAPAELDDGIGQQRKNEPEKLIQ